jgi:hypothetical protein
VSVNDAIQSVGVAGVIKRTPTDINIYVYIKPKLKAVTHEYEAWFETDSGVVDGDLIAVTVGGSLTYYLVAGLVPDERASEFFKYNAKLFRCNHTIKTLILDDTTKKFVDGITGIPCLITDGGITQMSDRGVVLPGFGGKDDTYSLYCQPNGITRKSALVDDDGRQLKISGNINPYFAKGIYEISIKLEGN